MRIKVKGKKLYVMLLLTVFCVALGALNPVRLVVSDNNSISINLRALSGDRMLDPTLLKWTVEYLYLDNLAMRLISLDKEGNYENRLASNLSIEHNRIFTFTLEEAYFSNGERITCHDVMQSFKRAILKGVPHSRPNEYILGAANLEKFSDEIEGLQCDGEKFVLSLVKPIKEIYYYLQLTDFTIYPKELVEKDALKVSDWEYVSSGAYILERKGSDLSFVANPYSREINSKSPKRVTLSNSEDEDIKSAIINHHYDIGRLTYSEFIKTKGLMSSNYFYTGDFEENVLYISLNSKGSYKKYLR